jgi:hypothetical protein
MIFFTNSIIGAEEGIMDEIIPIHSMIHEIRGRKVMLDSDLADLYQVGTKVLNQAVKRNMDRFPQDFMFQLDTEEWLVLRSQFGAYKFYNSLCSKEL